MLDKIPKRYNPTGAKFSGGQGDVFVCRDNILERDVAIKFIQDGGDPKAIMTEIRALQTIRSKHVVELYDVIPLSKQSSIGLVQEYVPGNDLFSIVPKSPSKLLPTDYFLNLMYQLASGIKDIHASGSIHRDIKPNNIKINAEGILKIFDFGLAKNLKPKATTKGFKGTHLFAAPELYKSPPTFNGAVDVYAFGITAWLIAVGHIPPELENIPPGALTTKLSSVRKDLPASITNAIERALSVNSSDRPSSPELADILERRLVYGKHRGVLSAPGQRYLLEKPNDGIKIDFSPLGVSVLTYDGERFYVEALSGDVYVNAVKVDGKIELTGASVLIFGSEEQGPKRKSLPFYVSHPELVL